MGVIFTVPLRYAMVVKSDLPYPEGVAAAEILKVGDHDADQQEGGSGIKELVSGRRIGRFDELLRKRFARGGGQCELLV